ncbi:hypothetical protein RFN28_13830 [Mesorhizobium sp. VK24D]|uniref:Aminoglycoside phosphotransferase domain-containing protein n=1 Tax=Mesorhizobium album TaxID=3072314 RepID=A0ABU4XXX2_9HYPH|nr:hypothetical protein [Mesorhizobium sp. VK24D]MDX8479552.1 hypothetical protein [Mesorhizobium sp. VK24D]
MIDLAAKVRFLSDAGSYPHAASFVEARETHMSWVFLTEDRVYKLKKPVQYPFLDFGTPARRRFFCEEELRLNKRLAPDTYCSVTPLRCTQDGRLTFGVQGRIVDWLIEMKRLPEVDLLDVRLRKGVVTGNDIHKLGDLLAGFYSACSLEIEDGGLYLKSLVKEQAINRAILGRPALGVSDAALPLFEAADTRFEQVAARIKARIEAGTIVEGHGDLRPEHVYIGTPMQVIDCLEFDRSMRVVDPYDEINYLGLECAMLGARWVRPALLGSLEARLGGRPDDEVLSFYGAFRMLLRARLCMAHLFDPVVRDPDRWRPLALSYIAAAKVELSSPSQPIRKLSHSRAGA